MVEVLSIQEMKDRVGKEMGVSDWMVIDQERINTFADCTEDHQWIHVDVEKAKEGPFGGPIAHGFLVLSLIPHLSAGNTLLPEDCIMAVNYGLNKVRFVNPVPVGAKIRDRAVLTEVVEKGDKRLLVTVTHTMEIEGQEKPACVAESLAMFVTA